MPPSAFSRPLAGHPEYELAEGRVFDLFLPVERLFAGRKYLEVAAPVEHVDPIDIVARDLQFRQINVVDLARISRPKTGGCHGRIVSPRRRLRRSSPRPSDRHPAPHSAAGCPRSSAA